VNFVSSRLELDELNSSVAVTVRPTVPISCPPCSMTLRVVSPAGLTVSTCSLTYSAYDSPLSGQTVNIRAVPTAGSNSRNTLLQFHPVNTFITGSGWDHNVVTRMPVSSRLLSLCDVGAQSPPRVPRRVIAHQWDFDVLPVQLPVSGMVDQCL